MSIENNELPQNPSIESETVRPFRRFCTTIMTIGSLPSSYQEAMSYQEMLLWLCDFIKNKVIPAFDNNANAITELQNLFVQLKNYVDNYFTDLDVQKEINNKLDEMTENGTLTNLIENYVNPIYQNYENEINGQINNINNKVNSITSGTPAGVYQTLDNLKQDDLANKDRIYVVQEDGSWYYYNDNTEEWTKGGIYQSSIETYDIDNLKNNNDFLLNNFIQRYNNIPSMFKKLISRQNLELYSEGNYIDSNGILHENENINVYKYDLDEKTLYLHLIHATNDINIKGCFSYINSENQTIYNTIEDFYKDNDTYNPLIAYFNGARIKTLYMNYDKTSDLGIETIELYYACGETNPNIHLINPFKNIIDFNNVIVNNNISPSYNYYGYFICKIPVFPTKYEYYRNEHLSVTSQGSCFDENDNYLGDISYTSLSTDDEFYIHKYKLSFPENTSYIKANINKNSIFYCNDIIENNSNIINKTFATCINKPYNFNGKIANFFGDSITWLGDTTSSYAKYFSDLNNLSNFNNYGVSGTCFASGTGHDTIQQKIESVLSNNADFIFIAGGVNDCYWNVPLGSIDSTNQSEFYGALNNLATYLNENYSNKEIIFILPIIATRENSWDNEELNNNLDIYRQAIYNVCIKNKFSVVNGLDFAFPDNSSPIFTDLIYDNIHPSELGRVVYAKSLSAILN